MQPLRCWKPKPKPVTEALCDGPAATEATAAIGESNETDNEELLHGELETALETVMELDEYAAEVEWEKDDVIDLDSFSFEGQFDHASDQTDKLLAEHGPHVGSVPEESEDALEKATLQKMMAASQEGGDDKMP